MKLNTRQVALLNVALTKFYDEVAKTSTPELKQEIMKLARFIQDNFTK